jgi:DNA-binding transcriptional MerR regulator
MIEVCRAAGISRSTLLRWLKSGLLPQSLHRDKRGWRLFKEADLDIVRSAANKIS